ncbi:MAG: hypothetical protein ACOC6H_03390 [Thermoproteota archaeon]
MPSLLNEEKHQRKSVKILIIVLTSVMLVCVSKFSSSLHHTGQTIFATILTVGVLATYSYDSAILISLIAGGIYSFLSFFGPLILVSWAVRGLTVALLFRLFSIFKSNPPSAIQVSISMTLSSFATGMTHYLFLIKFLKLVPDPPLYLVMFTISISVVSTLIASFFATKVIFPRIKSVLHW